MAIKITSDSTCDLTGALLKRHDIALIPLYIIKNGKVYRDGVDITPADIFAYVEATGDFCTTAAVHREDYAAFFGALSPRYDAVIHVSLGSGFSLCHKNAVDAAGAFDNVYVVDSKNLSSGHGHVVLEAARLCASGLGAKDVARQLRDVADRVETSFLIDRLDYIFKGGRCSLAAARGADIFHLRTCVGLSGGKMQVAKKYRGSFESCVGRYVRDRLEGRGDLAGGQLFITHAAAPPAAVSAAFSAAEAYGAFDAVTETQAGCTISCHCGPKTLGVLYIRRGAGQNNDSAP